MSIPYCCPACNGGGQLSRAAWVDGGALIWADTSAGPYRCVRCGGTGVVWKYVPEPMLGTAQPFDDWWRDRRLP